MKKIIWIIALLVVTFIGDRIAGWILKQQVDNSQFRYSRLYTDRGQSDVLLIGNSRGLIFYEPYIEEVTSKKTLNLSYNGMSVDLMNRLVQDYFERYPAPKQMIVDVTICDRINDQLTTGFNTYSPYSKNLENLILKRGGNMGNGAKVSHLFRYNSEIFQRALYYRNKSDKDWLLDRVINQNMIDAVVELDTYFIDLKPDPDTIKDGYRLKNFEDLIDTYVIDIKPDPDATKKDYLLENLKALVDTAKEKGTDVQLVINPYYPPFAKTITNLTAFKSEIETYTGMKVNDYSSAVTDVKGFGDYQHLNKHGARIYLDKLRADGILK